MRWLALSQEEALLVNDPADAVERWHELREGVAKNDIKIYFELYREIFNIPEGMDEEEFMREKYGPEIPDNEEFKRTLVELKERFESDERRVTPPDFKKFMEENGCTIEKLGNIVQF